MYEEEDQSHQLRMMRASAHQHRNLDNNILDLLQQSALARAQAQWMSNPAFQHMSTLQMYQMNQAQAQFQGNALQSPGGFAQTNLLGFTQNPAFNQQPQPSQPQGFQLDKAFAFNAQQQVSTPQAQMVSPQQIQRTPSAQQQQTQTPQPLQDFQQQAQFTGLSSFVNFDGAQTPHANAALSPQSAVSEMQQQHKQHELFLQQQLQARRQAYMHLAQQQQKQLEQQAIEQQTQELPKQEEQYFPDPLLANLKSEPTEIDEPAPFTKPQQLNISASQDKFVEVQSEQLPNAPYESPLFSNLNLLEFDTDESLLPDDAVKALLDEYDWTHQEFGTVDTYS